MNPPEETRLRNGLQRPAWGLGLLVALAFVPGAAPAQTGPLKPKVPPGRDPGGVAVAIIGAGADYRRPEIAARIARDGEGEIIAWDVIDDDARPLEAAPVAGRRVPPHAGTVMAQLLLAEAKAARLIPVRIPDANPLALGGALAFAGQTPARIAVLLVASDPSPQAQSWQLFIETARRWRRLLLIAPAGHHGGDADTQSAAPAGTGLDNLIVVTAADGQGRIADGASWGATKVDIAIPPGPEEVPAGIDAGRAAALENGAAIRLAALAARLAALEPDLDGPALKARVLAQAKPLPAAPFRRTRLGWIENPGSVQMSR